MTKRSKGQQRFKGQQKGPKDIRKVQGPTEGSKVHEIKLESHKTYVVWPFPLLRLKTGPYTCGGYWQVVVVKSVSFSKVITVIGKIKLNLRVSFLSSAERPLPRQQIITRAKIIWKDKNNQIWEKGQKNMLIDIQTRMNVACCMLHQI